MLYQARKFMRRFIKNERGTQLIEFAIVFPTLILLFAGTTELGRLFYTYTSLAKATRAGARYLSNVQNITNSTAAAKNVVLCGDPGGCGGSGQPSVILPNFSASNVVVTQQTIGTAKYVTVSITGYPYQPLIFDLNAMVGASFNMNLSPSTQMRYMVN
jgi:Flp pilus assembly protein TadG